MTSFPHPGTTNGGSPTPPPKRRFRETAIASGLLEKDLIDAAETQALASLGAGAHDPDQMDRTVAGILVARGLLTKFQADQMLLGRSKLTLNQYRILDQVGQGGMGSVFKARHAMMQRVVAVKVLTKDKATKATEAAFLREIAQLGDLDHENLLRAHDAGRDGKVYYLVTEYIEGLDLRRQVQRHGPLDERTAASVIVQAARGLACAHERGVVHRDVKPGNLLATKEGRVKVLDLGLAGSVFDMHASTSARIIGTMDYMAPEQIRNPANVRAAADIYGLGCTLYYLLTGQVPFPGGTRDEKQRRQLSEEPVPVRQLAPHVSPAFCRVVEAMMRKNPAERIASASELLERLAPWTPEQPLPMPRRRRTPEPAAAQQPSSRDSTQGPLSLSEETAGGSHADTSGEPFGESPAAPSISVPHVDGPPRPLLGRAGRGTVARMLAGLRDIVMGDSWADRLRMAAVAAVVAVAFSAFCGVLGGWLGLFPRGFALLAGGFVFAVMFAVQVWAARSAGHDGD